jgi:transposase-like protein
LKLKASNRMARFLKEAQRKSKVVAVFPDERSALLLVAAKLKRS